MNKFLVETKFSRAIYKAEYYEMLRGGVFHLYNKNGKNQIETEFLFSPPYDVSKSPS